MDTISQVSPRMLCHLARIYDEWDGEDYEGSSCRGAMRGWHRHGGCELSLWPYFDDAGVARFASPRGHRVEDATTCPLGAYYRINKDSINDMQAAIHEVGAIYCSGEVHTGWDLDPSETCLRLRCARRSRAVTRLPWLGTTTRVSSYKILGVRTGVSAVSQCLHTPIGRRPEWTHGSRFWARRCV